MVHFENVTKLVTNDAVDNLAGSKHKKTVEAQISLWRTTAPECFLTSYDTTIWLNLMNGFLF